MPNQTPSIEATFGALSDPTRLAVVAALCNGPSTVSDLAAPFDMALPSFTQHLGVLENAGLIVSRRQGRARVCELNPGALRAAEDRLAAYRLEWEARLDRFETHLAKMQKETRDD
ncbi:MAG: metalloregulator ArsR/SmtB family transcription factor [Pseudomonadota bacterium]|nr:metalloregulator ArsR/SmtB family transcription factor [Pseudomonadota bacterium]